jgi:hypothetical protein
MFSGGVGQGFIRPQRGQSMGFALLVHRVQQLALRARSSALRQSTTAEENQRNDHNRCLIWIFHGTSPAI